MPSQTARKYAVGVHAVLQSCHNNQIALNIS